MISATEKQLGPIDILVNNAGVPGPGKSVWEAKPEHWWNALEVNLLGPYLCARSVLPGMIARRRGRIINVSSNSAFIARAYASAYCASKAALTHMTNCLAGETKDFGISVFAYAPGIVRTTMSEYAAYSPEVHDSVGELFRQRFAEGTDTPMGRAVQTFMLLTSGRVDVLSGCHIHVDDSETELLGRADEIRRDGLYTLGLRT